MSNAPEPDSDTAVEPAFPGPNDAERPKLERTVGDSQCGDPAFGERLSGGEEDADVLVSVGAPAAVAEAGAAPSAGSTPAAPTTSHSAGLTPFERVIPTWTDATVRRAADAIGGPLGRHALVGRSPILTPLRVALLMAILFLIFGWLAKSPCIQQTGGPNGTQVLDSSGNRQWITGCYNDIVPTYQINGLASSDFPYAPHYADDGTALEPIKYPVVVASFMWAVSQATNGYQALADSSGLLPKSLDVAVYFTLGAIALALLYLWAVASTLKISRRRPWDVAIMCLSPLLVVQAFSNWDIIPVALLAAAMLAWSRSRPLVAGVLLGVAIAAKLYPVLLLLALFILCFRAGKLRSWVVTATAAVITFAVINVPVALSYPDAWREFFVANIDRKDGSTSWYSIYSDWSGFNIFNPELATGQAPTALNAVSALLFLAACIGIGWLGLSAARRPRVAQLMFLVVAAFLLTSKLWNPQFSLWLLPLVVLALPRWRIALLWQLSEAAMWFLLMLSYATKGSDGNRYALLPQYPFQVMALIRDVLVIMMVVMVVREILRPASDLVRQAGDDDPTGGVLANAPDTRTMVSLPSMFRGWAARRARAAGARDPLDAEQDFPNSTEPGWDGQTVAVMTAATPEAMGPSMSRGEKFEYVGYEMAPEQNQLTCRYRLDGRDFTEVVVFPGGGDWTHPAVAEAARLVFLLTAVSYYKASAPPIIDLGKTAITDNERAFLYEFFVEGLGEFAFRNNPPLDLSDVRIVAPALERTRPVGFTPRDRTPLLPFGGGVDSIVSVEIIKPLAPGASLFVVNRPGDTFEAIEKPALVTGLPVVRAERLLDEQILRSRELGFFNGHVPVTGIISAIGVMAATLGGHDAVVMSNEWSASVGTVEVDGKSINHQYSKSESFEAGFRSLIADAIGGEPDYFSLLRPYTELWIARNFASLEQYFPTFRSCNRSFHIDKAHRLDHWCGVCDKCCFIDLILSPFVDATVLRRVFDAGHLDRQEPLDNPILLPKFRTLLGLSPDTKPWECVGDIHECQVATRIAVSRPDRAGSPILQALVAEMGEGADEMAPDSLLSPVGRHFIPERYAPADLLR
ncbi:DUF2029 domain-containing protein [Nakamurella antarctica]|uniref:UDP-N-acetyl-alpha-D-muramoyl-L-alanyl-L-glutamate epimerase n=1 Tax=Nakamurella antarctica TaxID=1902245 RepID=A0A3G8ZR17_9ACTN|nr:glycosyltransferase 87 family protein [Nakamurella antarctica]AZI59255.1 DUF2029 domain-containing protein [Nakamurella antarctica]